MDLSDKNLEQIYQTEHQKITNSNSKITAGGKKYNFSQQLMKAAMMTNINFPIQVKGKNVRNHVPDKYFNCLYSWDSGFIGLGLSEFSKIRAIENLNAYLTEPDDDECAFILSGTPLPVQIYLYTEIWNRFQDKEMLQFFYPKIKHFYDFLAGHILGSTVREFKTDLLKSWDYFYNSGGWDDYPPQWNIYINKKYDTTPVVTTAHAIRFAKLLAKAATLSGHPDDVEIFQKDINAFTTALQKYSWDPDAKIFSYVEHDNGGNFKQIFRDKDSQLNYNYGMDGLSPLLSGICTEDQKEILFDRLQDPKHHWTKYGLSTVDMAAPYYRTDGYWNGCVWMPHQWFFWKSALDNNHIKFARKIAKTALDIWKNEVDQSFYCFEHFSLANGRGCGCHHFSGLSSPVLNWYAAYFVLGRLTGGFDLWITKQEPQKEGGIKAEIEFLSGANKIANLLYVAGKGTWDVHYCNKPVPFEVVEGTLEISIQTTENGTLEIEHR